MSNDIIKVALYWPNIIGYVRLLLILSCFFIPLHSAYIIIIFAIASSSLDMADGYAARYFNQVSFFGTVLDYIIDRTETILYVTITSLMFPGLARLFHLILTLDIASHISRLYTTINHGEMHHKKLTSSFRLLNLYYSNRIILILSCFTYNAFFGYFGFKYVLHSTPEWLLIIFIITMPGFIFKNIVHVLQLLECFKNPLGENQSQFIKIV